jgi:V/A-type H+-transporting ATPase subunit I
VAVVTSKEISIYGLRSQKKAILEMLQKSGAIEISNTEIGELHLRKEETVQMIGQTDSYLKSAQRSLDLLDEYAPEKSSLFSSREELPIDRYHMETEESDRVLKDVLELIRRGERIHENAENICKIDTKQIALNAYAGLDVPMQILETEKTFLKAGVLTGEWAPARMESHLADRGLDTVHFEIIECTKEHTTLWLVYPKTEQKRVAGFLQEIGFQDPPFSSAHPPKREIEELKSRRTVLLRENEKLEGEIRACADRRGAIRLFYDHLLLRKGKYEVLSRVGVSDHIFLLNGYVLQPHAQQVKKSLEHHFDAYVELTEPQNPDAAPLMLSNNAFVRPVEGITEMYSMPGTTDIDPTPIMAFFYYFFFGMMFSDAGYGIMTTIVCGLLGYGQFLEPSKRRMFQMLFFCGISTTFWGVMYGSFFGDAITVFSDGAMVFRPLWLDPIAQPMNLLIFSVAIGLVHVCVALGVKFYTQVKQKDIAGAVFDTLTWLIVLGGVGVLALGAAYAISMVQNVGMWCAIGGLALLVCTHGRHHKNIFMKIFGGILGIYDITGYIGDILSYSRLMALGLSTGVIASVINLLGPIFGELVFGDSPLAIIIVVVLFVGGHLVNFAINMLGAYVHTNRLQYVEFFSKFYEGGGRKFVPFGMDTKYYRFTKQENGKGVSNNGVWTVLCIGRCGYRGRTGV